MIALRGPNLPTNELAVRIAPRRMAKVRERVVAVTSSKKNERKLAAVSRVSMNEA